MIAIINGPNLNMLGHRDPQLYGTRSLDDILPSLAEKFPDVELSDYQSNHEGDIIDAIQRLALDDACDGIVINPGAFAHYSYAIADAIADATGPCGKKVVEVHLSNIFGREDYRRRSVTAAAASAVISGAGEAGYALAVDFLLAK